MKLFRQRELREAYAYAKKGGQALHVFSGAFAGPDAPKCFVGQTTIAHLFDQDRRRLHATARNLGVRVIKIEYGDDPERQHVDLCGKPLLNALNKIANPSEAGDLLPESGLPGVDVDKVQERDYAVARIPIQKQDGGFFHRRGQIVEICGPILRFKTAAYKEPIAIKRDQLVHAWRSTREARS